jgi:hypothetical protein
MLPAAAVPAIFRKSRRERLPDLAEFFFFLSELFMMVFLQPLETCVPDPALATSPGGSPISEELGRREQARRKG